jgi:hypothetical protein
MRRVDLRGEREVTAPGSVSARVRRLAAQAHAVVIEIGPGGVVESGSNEGMTVLVVEAESLDA